MKALEMLKFAYSSPLEFTKEDYEEVIAELEALQEDLELLQQELKDANEAYLILLKQYHTLNEPKYCDGCKYEFTDFKVSNGGDICNYCSREHVDSYKPRGENEIY